ncbi:MAG: NAD-dependent malic enzyme [Synergistaceae bacterium]|jgi:malate dehydrogenase (oxaloacetate-decarboxylating)|nr:NAD-dependent malic enzyme [Synergistaceae bacterium]
MTERKNKKEILDFHRKALGKVRNMPTVNIRNERQLGMAYVPGSLAACAEIRLDGRNAFEYTGRGNRLAEVSNGKSVFGMNDIGPDAVLPILEGKALMLKLFGDLDAVPMAIRAETPEEIVNFCRMVAPTVGGVNIEHIGSPDAYFVERALSEVLDIPVFCGDRQGTAVTILAAIKNSVKLLGISMAEARIVVIGAGVAGLAAADLLLRDGASDLVILDERGILGHARADLNVFQSELAARTNPREVEGGLNEALSGADILVGLSRGNIITKDHIKRMNRKPVVLALSLPEPEISREDATHAGAFIYASGNTEESNALLNIHAFPGIVRGALDVRAKRVSDLMLLAASDALAAIIDRRNLTPDHIYPKFFGSETSPRIAEAVAQAATNEGIAYVPMPEGKVFENTWYRLFGAIEHI